MVSWLYRARIYLTDLLDKISYAITSLITEHDRIIGKVIEWKCVSAIVEQAGGEPKTLQYIFFK